MSYRYTVNDLRKSIEYMNDFMADKAIDVFYEIDFSGGGLTMVNRWQNLVNEGTIGSGTPRECLEAMRLDSALLRIKKLEKEIYELKESTAYSPPLCKESEEYIKNGGVYCPVCKKEFGVWNEQTKSYGTELRFEDCHCDECNASWTDVYRLVGINSLEKGDT